MVFYLYFSKLASLFVKKLSSSHNLKIGGSRLRNWKQSRRIFLAAAGEHLEAVNFQLVATYETCLDEPIANFCSLVSLELQNFAVFRMLDYSAIACKLLEYHGNHLVILDYEVLLFLPFCKHAQSSSGHTRLRDLGWWSEFYVRSFAEYEYELIHLGHHLRLPWQHRRRDLKKWHESATPTSLDFWVKSYRFYRDWRCWTYDFLWISDDWENKEGLQDRLI